MDTFSTAYPPRLRQSPMDHLRAWVTAMRDFLDARGRGAWIAATILAFIFAWPVGLGLLAYIIWSKRMTCHRHRTSFRHGYRADTGNAAFDAYRAETLRRLEQERDEFVAFLNELRHAKDKAEFDQFMSRRNQG